MSLRAKIVKECASRFAGETLTSGAANELEIAIPPGHVLDAIDSIFAESGHLLTVYATEEEGDVVVRYVLDMENEDLVILLRSKVDGGGETLPSLAEHHAAALWQEREIRDLFGIPFLGLPDSRPLVLHDVEADVTPLRSGFTTLGGVVDHAALADDTPLLPRLLGGAAAVGRFGPVRGLVEESVGSDITVIGEKLIHVEPVPFFKHRGVERLVVGKTLDHAATIAERVCGVCALSNAAGFAIAVESLVDLKVPDRAVWLRTGLLEIERIAAHALTVAGVAGLTGFVSGRERAFEIRERLLRACESQLGARLLTGVIVPGGTRRDIASPKALVAAVRKAATDLGRLIHDALDTESVVEHLKETGTLTGEIIRNHEVTGPAARATGVRRDTRVDHPYLAYGELSVWAPVHLAGDALSRLRIWQEEIEQSAGLAEEVLANLPSGAIFEEIESMPESGRGFGIVETARGTAFHAVHTDEDGELARWHLRSPSAATSRAATETMTGSRVAEIDLIEKSFAICRACIDR